MLQYAIKFFTKKEDFETEAAFYRLPEIAAMMPPLSQICDNSDQSVCSPGGYVYPPFIIVERGITLSAVRTPLLQRQRKQRRCHGACAEATDLGKATLSSFLFG
jgi:hypothetical protein